MKFRWPLVILLVVCAISSLCYFLRQPGSALYKASPPWVRRAIEPASVYAHSKAYEALMVKVDGAYLTPITFYGKVMDQHGEPVPDADVTFDANDSPSGGSPSMKGKTDAKGEFSIAGIHGITLSVGVSKHGYRGIPPEDGKVTSSGFFEYYIATGPPAASHKETPAIFTLHKVGVLEPLVKIKETFRFSGDGKPFSIPVDQRGGHVVVVKCLSKRNELPEGQRNKYDWNFEITVPDGGLVERKNAYVFEAPESDYKLLYRIEYSASMPMGSGGWSDTAERSYFIHFNDGSVARVKLHVSSGAQVGSDDNATLLYWKSFLNPKVGSRNLESGENDP